jgi:TolB-like protein
MRKISAIVLSFLTVQCVSANVTVVISSFKNESDQYYLDSWEKTIPDMLKSELSAFDDIVVLERQAIEDILKEQALSMTGLVDSTTVQRVGKLLGAQYVINGTISSSGAWIRIDAKIIRVETGQLRSEKAQAKGHDHLNEMMRLLGNNVGYVLSGKGSYKEAIKIKQCPVTYFVAATLVLGGSAYWVDTQYRDKYDAYHQTTSLTQFDSNYDEANRLHKIRNTLYGLTGVALAGTIYCLVRNISPDEILAQKKIIIPNTYCDQNGRLYAGITLYF